MAEKLWLSRKEVCKALGISLSTLNRMVKVGIIDNSFITYIGRRILFDAELSYIINTITQGRSRSLIKEVKNV